MSQPTDPSHDPFAPPKTPCEVQCVHCGESYESWRIEWRDEPDQSVGGGFWCCPTAGCDGVGFGFDIFPVDPAWTDEHGEHLIAQFDDEDDEDDDELDFEDDEDGIDLTADMPVDTFDADSFWIDAGPLLPRPVADSPQPPFNIVPPGKSFALGDDDIPF